MSDSQRPPQEKPPEKANSGKATSNSTAALLTASDGAAVIEAFGGIRPMAGALGVAVSTIQGWKARNQIPDNRWEAVLNAALEAEVSLMKSSDKEETIILPGSTGEDATLEEALKEPEQGSKTPTQDEDQKSEAPNSDKHKSDRPKSENSVQVGKSGGSSFGIAACLLALIAIAAIATRGYWGPIVDPLMVAHLSAYFGPIPADEAQQRETDALTARLTELSNALQSVENSVTNTLTDTLLAERSARESALTTLADELAAVTEKFADLPSVSTLDLETVADRLSALETAQTTLEEITSDATTREALNAFRMRLNAMSQSVEGGLKRFQDAVGGADDRFAALTARLTATENRLAELQDQLAAVEDSSIRSSQADTPSLATGPLLLAVGQVETALRSGTDPAGNLQLLREISAGRPDLIHSIESLEKAIEETSAGGVSRAESSSNLISDFVALAPIVDKAERLEGAEGWFDETLAALRGLVSIRRTGDSPDLPIASQIEAALQKADIATAVTLIQPFSDADPEIATWFAAAHARVTIDAAILHLRETAIAEAGISVQTPSQSGAGE